MGVGAAAKDRSCKHCGSDGAEVAESFDDGPSLAAAVAAATVPDSIRGELEKAIAAKPHLIPGAKPARAADPRRFLRDSIVDGELTIERALLIAAREGIPDETARGIIEVAEMEGILLRLDEGRWRSLR